MLAWDHEEFLRPFQEPNARVCPSSRAHPNRFIHLYPTLHTVSEKFECEVMDWDLFYELSMKTADKIIASGFKPDFMVGLARGGWVLSRVLCDFLGVKDLVSLKVEHWGVTATPDGSAQIKYPFQIELRGRKVLIVDDITDTGESMKVAKKYVETMNPLIVKTATLRTITGSKFRPDYFGDEISWRWVVFPWNFNEDMCNIVPKAAADGAPLEEVVRRLKANNKLDLSVSVVERILQEAKRRKI
jgi:hypoxanthine phosphoribosyltransferase